MTSRNERQMWNVQNLEIVREDCTLNSFRTEEWTTGHVYVKREYSPNHAKNISYSECYVVGPRGGVKQLSSYINYLS